MSDLYFDSDVDQLEPELCHYGVSVLDGAPGRGSGRYPRGSGDNPNQHFGGDFLTRVENERRNNVAYRDPDTGKLYYGDTAIAKRMKMSTTEFRTALAVANENRRSLQVATARRLRKEGNSLQEIAKLMGFKNDSSVRSLLNENSESRMDRSKTVAEYLKKCVAEKGMIDVGRGVEYEIGPEISRECLEKALYRLKFEGYEVYGGGVAQVTNPGKQTNLRVLCPPGTEHKDIYNLDIHSVKDYDQIVDKDGTIRKAFTYPESMDSSRLAVVYGDQKRSDGTLGVDRDGLIEIRRGCPDLDLQDKNYAQVRILVDGTHYIKGMAVYSDNLPDGVDVQFNTNKLTGTPVKGDKDHSVLKPIKKDPENPFGSTIKDPERGGQYWYTDKDGNKKMGLINKKSDEGDWGDWSDKLPSQFLSKQPIKLINQQLGLTVADKKAEYDEICSLTNPTVKKSLLSSFADDCDSAAIHLKAAALPGQKYQVILPIPSLKDHEVYAPNFPDGSKVALVRYPHGGTFEIPILKVNNKNAEGNAVITKNAADAVGINKKVAEKLSGADFDGDTVTVIPITSRSNIMSTPSLKGLEGFDNKAEYGPDSPGSIGRTYKRMSKGATQNEMGKITNLITDMTIRGANADEIARAVKHSMVVIDAEKHGLDYNRSAKENGIDQLKRSYQGYVDEEGNPHGGASTLLSRAKAQTSVDKRQGSPRINQVGKPWYDPTKPEGSLVYKTADNLEYTDKNGKTVRRTQKSTQMGETSDAYTLVSTVRNPKELAYAEYANTMKRMAEAARMEMLRTGRIELNASAKKAYAEEVDSLKKRLRECEANSPRERQAQVIATNRVKAIVSDNPDIEKKDLKKIRDRELKSARKQVGAERREINLSDREWQAIQNGAISENTLTRILKYANSEDVRQRATPKATKTISDAKKNLAKAMHASGATNAQIAERLGISVSSVGNIFSKKDES